MLSFEPVPFNLGEGIATWVFAMFVLSIAAFIVSMCISLVTDGFSGPPQVVMHLAQAVIDLVLTSPRRCWAMTQLTFREAFRKKTMAVFAVFALLFLFGGWFVSDVTVDTDLQVKTYVSFVLRATSWLILPMALLLSCWGLPEDIKARSLHTVVTKPVRRHEIVLGRIFGYVGICSLVLVVVSVVGYFWIWRQLPDAIQNQLAARVPHYGKLAFISSEGKDAAEGINTGDENMFRSYIEGNTKARAIWTFTNLDANAFSAERPFVLESSFNAFRTYKGKIDRQLLCQYTLVNPKKNLKVALKSFEINEFRRNSYDVVKLNPQMKDKDKDSDQSVELKQLLEDGELRVETACLSSSQFLGMAKPDLFIRLPDRDFAASYFKCVANIFLMMVLIIVLGVMSGCFLKGPVATVLSLAVAGIGFCAYGFVHSLVTGEVDYHNPNVKFQGAGPFGALYRIVTHTTPGIPFEETWFFKTINTLDEASLSVLWAVSKVFPDLQSFDTTEYTANAFDVPWAEAMLPCLATTIGYCIPWLLVGYFSLRLRELESK
jgi:hypothetical protein